MASFPASSEQVFLVRLCPESAQVLDEVVDIGGVVAASGEGQGDKFLSKAVYSTILGPLDVDSLPAHTPPVAPIEQGW